MGSEAENLESRKETETEFEVVPPIKPEVFPQREWRGKVRRALDRRFMNLHGFVISDADRRRVEELVSTHDLTWVLNARTPNIIGKWDWPRAHLDLDDVPSSYLRSIADGNGRPVIRYRARAQQWLMRRRERLFLERFVTTSVCSEADRIYFSGGPGVHVIPNGFPCPRELPRRNLIPGTPRLGFIGLFSYAPNIEGVRWFLRECWPAIRKAIPNAQLRLIGKDTDGILKPTEPGVDALGWVGDPAEEIATWSAMIVPVHFGGGTRIKIAEAFSRKCPTVATSLGAFGYDVANGRQLLIADKPNDFAKACIEIVENPNRGRALAELAWTDFLQRWTWDSITPRVLAAAEDCLKRSHT